MADIIVAVVLQKRAALSTSVRSDWS